MIWPSADVDGKESSHLSTGNVVCPGDVDHQVDDVIHVEVKRPVGANGDVDNQLCSFGKRGVIVEGHSFWNQILVWGKKVVGVPIAVMQDCIC